MSARAGLEGDAQPVEQAGVIGVERHVLRHRAQPGGRVERAEVGVGLGGQAHRRIEGPEEVGGRRGRERAVGRCARGMGPCEGPAERGGVLGRRARLVDARQHERIRAHLANLDDACAAAAHRLGQPAQTCRLRIEEPRRGVGAALDERRFVPGPGAGVPRVVHAGDCTLAPCRR